MKKILLILIVLTSCVTKKKYYTEKEIQTKLDSVKKYSSLIKIDTVKVFKTKTVTKTINTYIEIPAECDENGNIKDLKYQVRSGNNKIKAIIKDNKLILEGAIDSTKTAIEKHYQKTYEREKDSLVQIINEYKLKESEKVVIKKPHWFLLHWKCFVIGIILLYLVYTLRKRF